MCPLGNAFVDSPAGDLNHDGVASVGAYAAAQGSAYAAAEVWPTNAAAGGWAAQAGEAHFAVECSGKGACDRSVGVCKCFDGYTGASCQRSA